MHIPPLVQPVLIPPFVHSALHPSMHTLIPHGARLFLSLLLLAFVPSPACKATTRLSIFLISYYPRYAGHHTNQ
jgi:hypothetical protein